MIKFREQSDLHGLITVQVDSWALLVGAAADEGVPTPQRELLRATLSGMRLWPIDAQLTVAATELVDAYRLPARIAWELAGASIARVDRVITPDEPLMLAASMLGYRTYSSGDPW